MNISAPKENYIFIELTGEDMKKLNITYADMDYSNVETRRVIWTLLDEAKHYLGKEFEISDDLKIEALPSPDGGCLLFFTISRKPLRFKVNAGNSSFAYRFENIDCAFDVARTVSEREKRGLKSSLYFYDGEYVLTLCGKLRHRVAMKLAEFADPINHSEHKINQITSEEYCLIRDNALDRLGFIT